MTTRYRGHTIERNPKPIPSRKHDWDFSHDDYDGAPDSGDSRCGTAESLEAAKAEIDTMRTEEIEERMEEMHDTLVGCDWCCGGGDAEMEELTAELAEFAKQS